MIFTSNGSITNDMQGGRTVSIDNYLIKLSNGQAYAQKPLLAGAMIAVVNEYQSGTDSAEVYNHAVALLSSFCKCKLLDLYTTRLRAGTLNGDIAKQKKTFCIPDRSVARYNSYDRRTRQQSPPTRPMTLDELLKELQDQLQWFAEKEPQRNLVIHTDLHTLETLLKEYAVNPLNGTLFNLLKLMTSFLLEVVGAAPNDHPELGQFLETELSSEYQIQDDSKTKDFKDPHAVARQLSSAIESYRKYVEKQTCRDYENASESLRLASLCAFGCYENALKHYLYHWTFFLVEAGKMDASELVYINNLKNRYDEKLNINEVIAKFKMLHDQVTKDPQIRATTITVEWELLSKGWTQNNDVKHRGTIPASAQELKHQIETLILFVRVAVLAGKSKPDFDSFLSEEQPEDIRETVMAPTDPEWDAFSALCGHFDGNSYHYVLVVPKDLRTEGFGRIFGVNWDMIIDLDPASEENGLMSIYQQIFGKLATSRMPHKHTEEFMPIAAPYWIRGNGILGNPESIFDNFLMWKRHYGQHFKELFIKFHGRYTRPVKVIYLPGQNEKFQDVLIDSVVNAFFSDAINDTYGVEQILMDNHELADASGLTSLCCTSLSLEQMLTGLATVNALSIPSHRRLFSGMKEDQFLDNSLELEEFCEPVYLSLGKETSDQGSEVRDFYRGFRKISWRELALRKDLPRDCYQSNILPNLMRQIAESENPFFTIGYNPGYGGTTLLRRIAWDLHEKYPTLIVHRYSPICVQRLQALRSEIETVGRLVLLIDSNDMSYSDADRLFRDLRINTIPTAIVYLQRRERRSDKESFTLESLKDNEIQQMTERLINVGLDPSCRARLERMCFQPSRNSTERTPFYLAMYAFDKDFAGFVQYVHNFLKEPMQEIYRDFLVYIALCNRISYGICLDVEFFAYHMDGVNSGTEAVEELRKRDAFSNLVVFQREEKLTTCKMRYPGIAEEVLRQMTSNDLNARDINYIKLAEHIRKFIERTCIWGYNSNLEDFLKRLLIDRDSSTSEGRDDFARIILDIGKEGKRGKDWSEAGTAAVDLLFKTLTDCYPDNPHFAGHYGRFLSEVKSEYETALPILDQAIAISHDGSDCTLLHMKGTIYSRMVDKSIQDIKRVRNRGGDPSHEIRMLQLLVNHAHDLFEQVRAYGSSGVTGMLSNIKLCISVIEMGKWLENVDTKIFFQNHTNDWYQDLLDRANSLFEECEKYAEDMNPADKHSYQSVQENIQLIRKSSTECIAFYEERIANAHSSDKTLLRRHLARIYDTHACRTSTDLDDPKRRDFYKRVMELMNDNIYEDPANTSNYRQWFRAAFNSRYGGDELVQEAIIKVNQWLDVDEKDCQAQLYRYMLTFLRAAVDHDTSAELRLKEYRQALQSASRHIARNTDIKFILTHGSGLQRLSVRLFNMTDAEEARKVLLPISGYLERRKNYTEATIRSYSADVFFNPLHTNGAIRNDHFDSKAKVTYGALFSYDGVRAHDATVELQISKQSRTNLSAGKTVKCAVVQRKSEYLLLTISGYDVMAKLYIKDLFHPYSEDNIPAVMTTLDVVLKYPTEISYRNEVSAGWMVTMDDGTGSSFDADKPLANNEQLIEYLSKHKN